MVNVIKWNRIDNVAMAFDGEYPLLSSIALVRYFQMMHVIIETNSLVAAINLLDIFICHTKAGAVFLEFFFFSSSCELRNETERCWSMKLKEKTAGNRL